MSSAGTNPPYSLESGHSDTIHDVQVDYYGRRIASCSSDKTVRVFALSDQNKQTLLAELKGHEGPVWQVAWAHPKFGNLIASCSYDRRVIVWKEVSENQWVQAHVISCHSASVNSVAFSPFEYGLNLACASSDGSISVHSFRPPAHSVSQVAENGGYNTEGGGGSFWEVFKIPQAHPIGVTSVSWAPYTPAPGLLASAVVQPDGSVKGADGSDPTTLRLVSGGCDNLVKIWKRHVSGGDWSLEVFPGLMHHQDWVRDVAWAPSLGFPRDTIASASQDGTVVIWSRDLFASAPLPPTSGEQSSVSASASWRSLVLKNFGACVWRVSWSLTGGVLAVADAHNAVTLWKESLDGEWAQVATV